jgi:cytoskeletal protein RodZ
MERTPERLNDFGGRMKRLREERGVALRDIADRTKVSVSVLQALERNDMSRLPGGIFSRGIVRAYAEQVGAEPDATVREFVMRFDESSEPAGSHPFAHDIDAKPPSRVGRRMLITLALAIPVAAVIVWAMIARV